MATDKTTTKEREVAIVNLYESQNIPGFANMKTIVAKTLPDVKLFEGPSNSVLVTRKGFPDFKLCHVKSIVYK